MGIRNTQAKENFTPQEVGSLLGVHHNTIKNWIRRGDVQAFTTVGGHFRVPRREVAKLVSGRGLPVPDELAGSPGVVYVVERDGEMGSTLTRALTGSYQVVSFHSPIEALIQMGRLPPDLLVFDLGVEGIDPVALGRTLHGGNGRRFPVLAVVPDGSPARPPREAFDAVVGGSAAPEALVEMAQGLLPSIH